MDDRNDKSAKCKFVLIMLCHMLILFVEGRRVEFMKNRELLMHVGTVKTIEVIKFIAYMNLIPPLIYSYYAGSRTKVMNFESFKSY